MIRKPNLSDLTVDIPMSRLSVTVGNEQLHNAPARRIPLQAYIEQLGIYSNRSYNRGSSSLLLPRDEQMLASAQACLLPLGAATPGKTPQVEFVPELYSYQSSEKNSTVLSIVASTCGTSAQIIRPGSQPLYFNRGDVAAKFVAKNLAQVSTAR